MRECLEIQDSEKYGEENTNETVEDNLKHGEENTNETVEDTLKQYKAGQDNHLIMVRKILCFSQN